MWNEADPREDPAEPNTPYPDSPPSIPDEPNPYPVTDPLPEIDPDAQPVPTRDPEPPFPEPIPGAPPAVVFHS